MGFKKIYLLGSDCDYGVTEAADFSKAWFHRPDQYKAVFDSLDVARHHFHPVIEGFEQMKKTIAGTGTTIYNATRGGKLEVFERVCYEDLLDKRS
jgi:hypothetical protein